VDMNVVTGTSVSNENIELYHNSEPPINPTPHPYLGVSWIRTLLYPGSYGSQ